MAGSKVSVQKVSFMRDAASSKHSAINGSEDDDEDNIGLKALPVEQRWIVKLKLASVMKGAKLGRQLRMASDAANKLTGSAAAVLKNHIVVAHLQISSC